jgi:hypothetical protein
MLHNLNRLSFRPFHGLLALLTFTSIMATEEEPDLNIKTTGYYIIDGGYVSETDDVGLKTWKSEPFGDFIGGLRLTAHPSEHFALTINPELKSHSIFPMSPGIPTGELRQKMKYDIYMEEGKGTWTLGNPEKPFSILNFGLFIYKDNPDAKVFGDYLFRSMIYPSILFTKFDYAQAQIFGFHANANFLEGKLKNNVFLLSEVKNYPFFDLSAAYSGSFNLNNVLEIGVGVNARSLVPVRPSRTTPKGGEGVGVQDNTYKFVPFQDSTVIHAPSGAVLKTVWVTRIAGTDSALVTIKDTLGNLVPVRVLAAGNGIAGLSRGQLNNKAMSDLTPANGSGDLFPELHGKNTHYSFQGTLLTGRMVLNPMGFSGDENPLGKNALKVYAEVAVLGWKNYDGFYAKRSERIPLMFGINLPTYNALDFLTIELERFVSHELPTYDKRVFLNVPQPGNHKEEVETLWNDERRKKDDLKWAVAAKKSFKGYAIVGQFGTDHTKLQDDSGAELFDVMSRPSNWYVQLRFVGGVY